MAPRASRLFHVISMIFGLRLILSQSMIPFYHIIQDYTRVIVGGMEQPNAQIVEKLIIETGFVFLILIIYIIFEFIHLRFLSGPNIDVSTYPSEELDEQKIRAPLLATILYQPVMISSYILGSIVPRIQVITDGQGGVLIIENYIIASILYIIPILLFFIFINSKISSLYHYRSNTEIRDNETERINTMTSRIVDTSLFTYLFRLAYMLIIVEYLVGYASFSYKTYGNTFPFGWLGSYFFIRWDTYEYVAKVLGIAVFGVIIFTLVKHNWVNQMQINIAGLAKFTPVQAITMIITLVLLLFGSNYGYLQFLPSFVPFLVFIFSTALFGFLLILFNNVATTRSVSPKIGGKSSYILSLVLFSGFVFLELYVYSARIITIFGV